MMGLSTALTDPVMRVQGMEASVLACVSQLMQAGLDIADLMLEFQLHVARLAPIKISTVSQAIGYVRYVGELDAQDFKSLQRFGVAAAELRHYDAIEVAARLDRAKAASVPSRTHGHNGAGVGDDDVCTSDPMTSCSTVDDGITLLAPSPSVSSTSESRVQDDDDIAGLAFWCADSALASSSMSVEKGEAAEALSADLIDDDEVDLDVGEADLGVSDDEAAGEGSCITTCQAAAAKVAAENKAGDIAAEVLADDIVMPFDGDVYLEGIAAERQGHSCQDDLVKFLKNSGEWQSIDNAQSVTSYLWEKVYVATLEITKQLDECKGNLLMRHLLNARIGKRGGKSKGKQKGKLR